MNTAKKMVSMFRTDFRLITRDSIVLYMALGPLLLAFILMAVMGGAGTAAMSFAATPEVPAEVVQNLTKMAEVRVFGSYDGMQDRVERADSAAGVFIKDGEPTLLLEGNESKEFKTNSSLLLSRAIAADLPEFESLSVQSTGNSATRISFAMLLLLCIFLGGAVAGFNMVAERESGAIRALAVSPLTLNGYLLARTFLALLLSLVNVVLCSLILGKGGQLTALLLSTLASVPVCGLVALTLGATSSNQIAATATIKLLMPACMIVPLASVFVPVSLKFLFWWIPVYWQYEAISGGLAGHIDVIACAFVFLTGVVWFAVLSKLTARKLGLRYNKRRY